LITTWAAPAVPTLIPCGSTTIVSRQPLVVAACVSYASINERYAPRASLELIRKAGHYPQIECPGEVAEALRRCR